MDDISKLKLDLLKGYIRELRAQGYNVNEIKASLIKNGAPRNLVAAAIREMPKTIAKAPAILPKPKPVERPSFFKPAKAEKKKPGKAIKLEEQIIAKAEALEEKEQKEKKTRVRKVRKPFFKRFEKKKPIALPPKPPKIKPKPAPLPKPVKPAKAVRLTPKHKHHVTWYILVVVIVALLGLLYFFMMPANCGDDSACFIEYANSCENAVMRKAVGTASFKFRANNCLLEKEIIGFSEEEPEAVKSLFTGLSMECSYSEGRFDANFINSLAGGIDKCSGKLKDTILEVRRTATT